MTLQTGYTILTGYNDLFTVLKEKYANVYA